MNVLRSWFPCTFCHPDWLTYRSIRALSISCVLISMRFYIYNSACTKQCKYDISLHCARSWDWGAHANCKQKTRQIQIDIQWRLNKALPFQGDWAQISSIRSEMDETVKAPLSYTMNETRYQHETVAGYLSGRGLGLQPWKPGFEFKSHWLTRIYPSSYHSNKPRA